MLSIHKTCRLCLSEESLSDVLDEEGLQQWIRDYLSITISPEDRISHNVCTICQIRLSEFHQFRLSCHEVQTVLQSMIQSKNAESETGLSNKVNYDDGQVRSTDLKSGYDHESSSEKHQRESYTRTYYEEAENGQQIDLGNIIHVEEIKIEAFESEQTLTDNNSKAQQKDVIDNDVSFECKICHKRWPSKKNLRRHYMVVHEKKKYKCSICEIGFAYRANLKQHFQTRNHIDKQKGISEVKPFKCDECEKSFQQKTNLNVHKRRIHGAKTLCCHVCGYKCSDRMSLAHHILRHDLKTKKVTKSVQVAQEFKCDICQKILKSSRNLNLHKRDVHGPKIYECHICSFSFTARYRLERHIPVHADQSEEYLLKLQRMKQNGTSFSSKSQDEAEANIKSDPDSANISATGQQMGQDTAVLP